MGLSAILSNGLGYKVRVADGWLLITGLLRTGLDHFGRYRQITAK